MSLQYQAVYLAAVLALVLFYIPLGFSHLIFGSFLLALLLILFLFFDLFIGLCFEKLVHL